MWSLTFLKYGDKRKRFENSSWSHMKTCVGYGEGDKEVDAVWGQIDSTNFIIVKVEHAMKVRWPVGEVEVHY